MKCYLIRLWSGIFLASELLTGLLHLSRTVWDPPADPMDKGYQHILWVWCALGVGILSLGAGTLFLNLIKKFRDSALLRFLSFFLLPLLCVYIEIRPVEKNYKTLFLLPVICVFFTCLTAGWMLFSRYLKKERSPSAAR